MGTAGAKAFGDALLVNKTIQHLNVSDNSLGKAQVGDQVKLKGSGAIKVVSFVHMSGTDALVGVDGASGWQHRPDEYELQSQVPAFCAGLAASKSLLSVSACEFHMRTILCADAFVSDCCPRLCWM